MKASQAAAAIAALIATDAKPTEAQILAAILAADKKGKDEGGLGPVEIEKKDKAKDEFPEKDDKAKDEKDDEDKAKDADMDDDMSEDEEADVQPKKSASGNSGSGGAEPAKDKKGMDTATAVKRALDARDALHDARRAVEPVLGVVTYDSAAQVYKAALDKLGVATDGVHASAYPALFKLARDKAEAQTPVIASDAATVTSMAALIPGYNRLK